MEEEDDISLLPDCLLIEIISRLPYTKYAIRTGTLSKRWQHLWPQVHNLIFSFSYYQLSNCASFVDKTLTQCRHLNLNKFQLHIPYDISFESQVNDWIRYAFSCNVQHLDLCLDNSWKFDFKSDFVLDHFFFSNSCFTHLKLGGCVIIPTGGISWSRLKSLYIFKGALDEDLIQNILSGSPLLETLELLFCYGCRRLDITSKSVKSLVFSECFTLGDDIVEINAPYVLSLTITGALHISKLLLLDVSSLVEAKLDYWKRGHLETTHREDMEEMVNGFMLKLRNVKELTIGRTCLKIFTRLKAKGLIFPSNIKYLDWYEEYEDEDENEDEEDDSD